MTSHEKKRRRFLTTGVITLEMLTGRETSLARVDKNISRMQAALKHLGRECEQKQRCRALVALLKTERAKIEAVRATHGKRSKNPHHAGTAQRDLARAKKTMNSVCTRQQFGEYQQNCMEHGLNDPQRIGWLLGLQIKIAKRAGLQVPQVVTAAA